MIKEGDLLWIDNSLKKPFADKHTPPEKKECEPALSYKLIKLSQHIFTMFLVLSACIEARFIREHY